jgi:heavy metal sensor kinase
MNASPARITRWLRFRLTFSFAIVLAILLCGIGFIFRALLFTIQTNQMTEIVDEEWATLRGYMEIEREPGARYQTFWYYDPNDPEQEYTVQRLKRTLLVADQEGRVLEIADSYRVLDSVTPEDIRQAVASGTKSITIRATDSGPEVMIRSGVMMADGKPFFVALGRSLGRRYELLDRFSFAYFSIVPILLIGASLLVWLISKRALSPVYDLAKQTETISGSNLKVRIASRGAGDEIDHLIENFNRMVERLEKAFSQTRQFSMDVSHELRTPLTVIRGHLEVALMTATSEEDYRDAIATALSDVERLSGMIRALLHLSQAESGQTVLQLETVNLAESTREAAEQFRLLAEAGQVTISCECADPCYLRADRVQMERMLNNLLSNAVKYTEPGGSIFVSVRAIGQSAELIVRDTGIGIPRDALPHIFERLYRVRGTRDEPEKGYGLGLSFVAWIVEAHGGSIHVRSEPAEGSEFRVVLPGVVRVRSTERNKEGHGISGQRAGA